jgi:hypothetical protein
MSSCIRADSSFESYQTRWNSQLEVWHESWVTWPSHNVEMSRDDSERWFLKLTKVWHDSRMSHDAILCHPLTIVLTIVLHISQGQRHKSSAVEEQVFYSVDFHGPPTRRTVTLLAILIESIEVAGRIKGCTFSLMLFVATPSPLSWQLFYTVAKDSDTSHLPLKSRFITVSIFTALRQDGPWPC